jgi:hypothetical protein
MFNVLKPTEGDYNRIVFFGGGKGILDYEDIFARTP